RLATFRMPRSACLLSKISPSCPSRYPRSDEVPQSSAINAGTTLEGHDRADRLAFVHQVEGLVDTFQRQDVRDQVIDIDLLFHVPVQDPRHGGAAPGAAECGALPHAPRDQLERPGLYLLARPRHA